MEETIEKPQVIVTIPETRTVESTKSKPILGLILGGAGGGTVGALDATLGYEALPPQIAQQMTDIGFLDVKIDGNTISYYGGDLDKMEWNGEYWDLETKLNLDSMLLASNAFALGSGASAFAIPFYAKKNPTLAAMHALIAFGAVAGNYMKHARLENLNIYSGTSDTSWTLVEHATNRPGISGTTPALFGLDELALGIYFAALGALGVKMGLDHRKNKLPSETVKGYNQDALGVKETF